MNKIVFNGNKFVQVLLVSGLRSYFSNIDDPMLKYDNFETKSKIWISSEYPVQRVLFPAIVVGEITGDPYYSPVIGRNQEMITYIKAQQVDDKGKKHDIVIGVQTHGLISVKATIKIGAYKQAERRNVKDEILKCVREEYLRDFFEKNGFTISDIKMGSATLEKVGPEYIYFDTISISGLSSWTRSNTDLQVVSGIEITDIDLK